MRQLPILTNIWNYLTSPTLPRTSLSIREHHLALIKLRSRGKEFEPTNLGVLKLPNGLVKASFTEPNITDRSSFVQGLKKTVTLAGLKDLKTLSATLPNGSARSLVVSFDNIPSSRAELAQMIEWKVERSIGHKFSELRVSYKRLSDFNGQPHWLVSAVHEQVIAQYEGLFKELDWQIGFIAPQHLGEAQWLMRSRLKEDQAVLSLNDKGFDAVIVRGDEPYLVRSVECPIEERENEFYRLVLFYRDRLLPENPSLSINRLLTIGNAADQQRFRDLVSSALEKKITLLLPQQLGLKVDPNAPFVNFAAAGGLATMAWG
jgi:hypothetical protein